MHHRRHNALYKQKLSEDRDSQTYSNAVSDVISDKDSPDMMAPEIPPQAMKSEVAVSHVGRDEATQETTETTDQAHNDPTQIFDKHLEEFQKILFPDLDQATQKTTQATTPDDRSPIYNRYIEAFNTKLFPDVDKKTQKITEAIEAILATENAVSVSHSEIIADFNEELMEDLHYQQVRQLSLSRKLQGHWSEDECRNCERCLTNKTYTHGVFDGTNPVHPPDPISVEDVRARAEPMSRSIWQDFEHLKAIVQRYELVLQRRWTKKSKLKRKKTLQSAWAATSTPPPQPLSEMHRPDMHYLCNRYKTAKDGDRDDSVPWVVEDDKRQPFFWPRLNLEDLAKVEPLLLLLNARGRYSPPTFAFADLVPVHFGLRVDQLGHPPYLDKYNMLFTGQEGPELYGQLVSWQDDPGAYRRLEMGRDTSPGEGLWILEIQQRLYRFLVNTCHIILHDCRLDDRDHLLAQPVAPEPPLPTANGQGNDIGTSLMITRNESAYHVPAKLDVRRLQNIVEARFAEAEDNMWALREDPEYFATTVAEVFQFREENLLDTAGKRWPLFKEPGGKDKFMADMVGLAWSEHLVAIDRWGLLCHRLSELADLKERLFDNAKVPIRPEDDLPPELAMAIYVLLFHLQYFMAGRLGKVFYQAQCSPPLRHLFRRRCPSDFAARGGPPVVPSGVPPGPEVGPFLWLLNPMSHPRTRRDFGFHTCVEDIERIARDPASHKFITKKQAADFSDYAIVSECIRQLELFQPWAATFQASMADVDIAYEIESPYVRDVCNNRPFYEWMPSKGTRALGAKLTNMPYPADKAPTKDNINAMRKAESALDAFWEAALSEYKDFQIATERFSKIMFSGALLEQTPNFFAAERFSKMMFSGNQPERTPMWVEPSETGTVTTQAIEQGPFVCPFDGGLGDAQSCSAKVKPVEPRIKVKSRGVARGSKTEPEAPEPRQQQQEQDPQPLVPPQIDVDQRAVKVLEMLFHKNSPGQTQGEIPWADFLYMMHHVGFGVEKLGGSVWQFTPGASLTACGYTRGILFHEPHPRAKIDFVVARRHGRRLARTYGWGEETFKLQKA